MNINIQSNEGALVWFWQHGGGFMEKIFLCRMASQQDQKRRISASCAEAELPRILGILPASSWFSDRVIGLLG